MKPLNAISEKPFVVSTDESQKPVYLATIHGSLIALILLTTLLFIIFATLSTASAFSLDNSKLADSPMGYAVQDSYNHKLGLVVEQSDKEVLPNVEEAAFNSLILRKAIGQARRVKDKITTVRASHDNSVNLVSANSSMSSSVRNLTIGFLGSIFLLMIWVTNRMWHEFNGQPSAHTKRRKIRSA